MYGYKEREGKGNTYLFSTIESTVQTWVCLSQYSHPAMRIFNLCKVVELSLFWKLIRSVPSELPRHKWITRSKFYKKYLHSGVLTENVPISSHFSESCTYIWISLSVTVVGRYHFARHLTGEETEAWDIKEFSQSQRIRMWWRYHSKPGNHPVQTGS